MSRDKKKVAAVPGKKVQSDYQAGKDSTAVTEPVNSKKTPGKNGK